MGVWAQILHAGECSSILNRYLGMSENGVYSQWNSHLVGIMISKTIGCRGTLFSDKPIWGSNLQWMDLWRSSTHQVLEKNWPKTIVTSKPIEQCFQDGTSICIVYIIDYFYQTYLPDIFTRHIYHIFPTFWSILGLQQAQVMPKLPQNVLRCWHHRLRSPGATSGFQETPIPLKSIIFGVPSFQETSNWGIPFLCYRLNIWWWTTDDSRRSKYWRSVETIVPRTPTETAAGGMNGSRVAVDSGKRPAILKARLRLRYLELCVAVTSFGWNMQT